MRRIVHLCDDIAGRGWGFMIKGDIAGKFYSELADAAKAKLDFAEIL